MLLVAPAARAKVTVLSVDCAMDAADLVVVARVTAVDATDPARPRVTLAVSQTLKGPAVDGVSAELSGAAWPTGAPDARPTVGSELVAALVGWTGHADIPAFEHVPPPMPYAGPYWLLHGDRVADETRAVDRFGQLVETRAALLAAASAPDSGPAGVAFLSIYVLPRDVGARLFSHSLGVPADARLGEVAGAWAARPDPDYRAAAARVFALRPPTPDAVAAVTRLLGDQSCVTAAVDGWVPDPQARHERYYPVRRAATAALASWGMIAGPAARSVAEPDPVYRPVPARAIVALISLPVAAALLAGLARRRRGARAGVGGWAAAGSLAAALLVALAWRLGTTSADTLSVAGLGADWDVSLEDGNLRVLRVADGAAPHAPLTLDRSPALWSDSQTSMPGRASPRVWYAPRLAIPGQWGRVPILGIAYKAGAFPGPMPYGYPAHLTVVSLPRAFLLLLLWPTARALAHLARRVRAASRARRRRCPHCGYDLRAGPTESTHGIKRDHPPAVLPRCPECGGVGRRPARPRVATALLALFTLLAARPAAAMFRVPPYAGWQVYAQSSVEAASLANDRLVRARVVAVTSGFVRGTWRVGIDADVVESFAGPVRGRVHVELGDNPAPPAVGDEVIIGLVNTGYDRAPFRLDPAAPAPATYWRLLPGGRVAPDTPALSMTGRRIETRDELLALLRAGAATPCPAVVTLADATLPMDISTPFAPGKTRLVVPHDARLLAQALAWARRPAADRDYRIAGVTLLATFPQTPDALAATLALLADPHNDVDWNADWSFDRDRRAERRYPVRRAAVDALKVWWQHEPPAYGGAAAPIARALLFTPREAELYTDPLLLYRRPALAGPTALTVAAVLLAACARRRGAALGPAG